MEWFRIAVQLVGSLVWPAVVLAIVAVFRKELRNVLSAIKEVKYPGGSITVEVARLEERVGKSVELTELIASPGLPLELPSSAADPQLAIAQLRTDVEKELLRLSWRALDRERSESWDLGRRIDELQSANTLTVEFAKSLRDFIRLANSIIHGAVVSNDVKVRLTGVGAAIVAQLHYQRKVLEAIREFEGHMLWHTRHHRGESRKFYFWSAVAASLPQFDYSYEIYREAAERHIRQEIDRGHEGEGRAFYILPLNEFVEVLEFREKEILRLIDTWHEQIGGDVWKAFEKANYWHWPQNWGDLGWQSPIIRSGLTIYAAEDDLVQVRNALNRYRKRLLRNTANPHDSN